MFLWEEQNSQNVVRVTHNTLLQSVKVKNKPDTTYAQFLVDYVRKGETFALNF